jgi:hypothetical protein
MNTMCISIIIAMLVMVAATMYVLCKASDTQEERLREYCKNCHEKCEDCPIGYRLTGKENENKCGDT